MAKTTTLPITQAIQNALLSIVNADSFIAANGGTAPTNTKLFFTAGVEGSIIKALTLTNDDTVAKVVSFYLSTDAGTTKFLLGSVTVPAGAGLTSGTTPNVDVPGSPYLVGMPLDQSGKSVIMMTASARLYVGVITSAMAAGRTVHIIAQSEDF